MSFNSTKEVTQFVHSAMDDKRPGEICMFFHRGANDMSYYNKAQLAREAERWRDLQREGNVELLECNNKDEVFIKGKHFYIFVVQHKGKEVGLDKTGMGWDDRTFLVDGFIYYFEDKFQRDTVYKYVMDIKDKPISLDEIVEKIGSIELVEEKVVTKSKSQLKKEKVREANRRREQEKADKIKRQEKEAKHLEQKRKEAERKRIAVCRAKRK